MQFVGLEPLAVLSPSAELQQAGRRYDLHNDATLTSLEYDYRQRVFRSRWVLREAAWQTPAAYERPAEAALVLSIHGVRSFACEGVLDPGPGVESQGLDFIEYQPADQRLGQVRFVFDNDAVIFLIGERCELHVIGAHQETA